MIRTIVALALSIILAGCSGFEVAEHYGRINAARLNAQNQAQRFHVLCTDYECSFMDAAQEVYRLHTKGTTVYLTDRLGKNRLTIHHEDLPLFEGKFTPRVKIYGLYIMISKEYGGRLSFAVSANRLQRVETWDPTAPSLVILTTIDQI